MGITLSATYNGLSSYGTSANITRLNTTNSGITVAGLLQTDYVSGITIFSPNVSANNSNYVTAISGSSNVSTNYSLPSVNYAATGGSFTGSQTPIAGTTNAVLLAKAPLGINLNAVYNGTTTYSAVIKTNGLVGADITPGVSSVTILSKDVSTVGNYITGVTGNAGVNDTNLLNNYIISSSASGTPTSGTPGSTTTNTVTLTAAPLGITLSATYNGLSSYGTSANITRLNTTNSGITVAGLLQTDYVSGITIFSPNVSANNSNYVTAISGSSNVSTNYSLPSVNYAATGGSFTGSQTPIAGTTNAVLLAKAPLGINLNAVYNGTTTYSAVIKTNGLVGADITPGVSSVTILSKDVSTVGNYITGVTGNAGVNDTNLLNNYIISSSASGTPTSGTPGSTTTNTVTLTKALLGINLNAVYIGTTTYSQDTQVDSAFPTIQTNGLVGSDSVTSVVINNANVSANSSNYIKAVKDSAGFDMLQNYTIANSVSGIASTSAPITNQINTVTLIPAPLGISVKATYNGTNSFNNTNATIVVSGLLNTDSIGTITVTTNDSIPYTPGNYVTKVSSNGFDSSNYLINSRYNSTSTSGICSSVVCSGSAGRTNIDGTNVVTITQVPTSGLPTIEIVSNVQSGSFGISKVDSSMIVANVTTPGQPDVLFPDKSYFIGNTRQVPYNGTNLTSLSVKIGTTYDNINPIDFIVVPDIYEMKNLAKN